MSRGKWRAILVLFLLSLLVVPFLQGCGTFSDAKYIMVSKGQADGLQGIITGGVGYCKLTIKGDTQITGLSGEQLKELCDSVPQ